MTGFGLFREPLAVDWRGLELATTNVSFSATVDAWTKASERRMEAVFRESTERVISEMQTPVGAGGNMPVDTGFLRASLMASTDTPATMQDASMPADGGSYPSPASGITGQVSMVILGAKIGHTIYACYTAAYAAHQEYGSKGRAGRGFVRLAAQRWQAIVEAVVKEAKQQ